VEVPQPLPAPPGVAPLSNRELSHFIWENLGEVSPGLLYRSARTRPGLLEFLRRRANLAHIIELRRECDLRDADFAERAGGSFTHLPMTVAVPPTARQILEMIRVTHRARQEGRAILLHCRAGADRTSIMVAIWRMLFQDVTDRAALKREAFCHRHVSFLVPMVHRTLDGFPVELFKPFVVDPGLLDDEARVAEVEARYRNGALEDGGVRLGRGPLRAGAAKADLLEGWSGPLPRASYGPRPAPATGVREPVFARAIVLESGSLRLALVSCDLLIMDPGLRQEALRRIAARGIALSDLLAAATHTHTSAGGYCDNRAFEFYMLGKFDRELRDHLAERIAEAVAGAAGALEPARLGAGRAAARGISFNRRTGSTIDPEVGLIKITRRSGEPLALVACFAAHPILEPDDGTISSDYPGLVARALDERFGFGFFLQGALGDLNACPPGGDERDWVREGLARQVADVLIGAIEETAGAIECSEEVTLGAARLSVDLPPFNAALIPDILFPLDWLLGKLVTWPKHGVVQVMRLGDAALASTSSEISARLGLAIKRRSPAPYPFVVTHANGYTGYAVERESYARSKLDPTSMVSLNGSTHGPLVVEALVELIEVLWEDEPAGDGPQAAREIEQEDERLVLGSPVVSESRRPGGAFGSFPDSIHLEASYLHIEKRRGGSGLKGRRREAGLRLGASGPWALRFAADAGYVSSEWELPGGRGADEGAADLGFEVDRPFTVLEDRVLGNALRAAPRLRLGVPIGGADVLAPFAFAASSGVVRPAAGGALELVWETYRTLSLEALYTTAAGRHRGRRPGDRLDAGIGYTERHGIVSFLLDLTAGLQLADSRRGGRLAPDVPETSFELALRPGLALHLGERADLFAQAVIPLARGGAGGGEGRGVFTGVMLGF
jgi:neutral ceramidase